MTLAAKEIPPFVEGVNRRYKSGEKFRASDLKIGDRIEVGSICDEGGAQLMFDSYEYFMNGGGPYGQMGTATGTLLTIEDRYTNLDGEGYVTIRTEWVKYGEDHNKPTAPTFTSADKTVVAEYDVTVDKTGLTGAAAKSEIVLNEGNKLVEGGSFKVADYDKLIVTITPNNSGSFGATAPTVTVNSGATAGTVTKGTGEEYTCEITSFTGNATITAAGTTTGTSSKTDVTITGLSKADATYDGTAKVGYTGTLAYNPAGFTGTLEYTYYEGTGTGGTKLSSAPINAGTYTVVAAIPVDNADYSGSHAAITFTIAKAAYTTAPNAPSSTPTSKSNTSITIEAVTPPSGETVEYAKSTNSTRLQMMVIGRPRQCRHKNRHRKGCIHRCGADRPGRHTYR